MSNTITIFIGYGLPGSGKTTYLGNRSKNTYRSSYVDVDEYTKMALKNGRSIDEYLEGTFVTRYDTTFFIDGLFTTNADLIKMINFIKKDNAKYKSEYKITVVYWNEDRDSCIWNDEYRRNESSAETIKNLPYEVPDKELILKGTDEKVTLMPMTVIRKSECEHDVNKHGIQLLNNRYLISSSWCIGGTICDCWGGTHNVSGEDPIDFVELDKFLEIKRPNLTFLQYKKIFRECVETDSRSEGDYYGGSITYMYYKCDMEKLYKILEEL